MKSKNALQWAALIGGILVLLGLALAYRDASQPVVIPPRFEPAGPAPPPPRPVPMSALRHRQS